MRSEFDDPADPYQNGERVPADPYQNSERASEIDPRLGETFRPWDSRPDAGWTSEFDLVGYHVEATDGSVGKVNQATHDLNGSHLIVDTGPWILGRTVVIPAGIVTHIDHTDRHIYLDRSKDAVKSSPDYSDEPAYWDKLAAHYGPE
jgi:hypothetical protein